MSQDFIAQYITTINNGIANTFQYFADGQYYRAVRALIPVLCYTITSDEKTDKALESIVEKINNIPKEAEIYRRGDTDSQQKYAHQQGIQLISETLYQDAIREIKTAIKKDILQGRQYNAATITELQQNGEWEEE